MTEKQKRQIHLLEKLAKEKGMLIGQTDIKKQNDEYIKLALRRKPQEATTYGWKSKHI